MTSAATEIRRSAREESRAAGQPPSRRRRPRSGWLIWLVVGFFLLNLLGLVASVVVDSFGTRWFASWLPQGFTGHWYGDAWSEFGLGKVLVVTVQVAVAVIVISLAVGLPAAYALARRDFPGKRLVTAAFLVPLVLPPITYGIPLATVLYKVHLAGTLSGVVVANLVPSIPFVILVMTPFIEQIDPAIESAARMCGAGTRSVLLRILGPLVVPGLLAAGLLILVRTIGMFELTFLTAGPTSQTLVVTLYYAVFSAGIRATQSVDAMAVIYMLTTLVFLVLALRFVNPTQLVSRVGERPED